ncbi:MAG: hypothetical protein IPO07_01760 [Haliscomenobacter sp.]|nr:hypothetical protein [Haliscomenobacter sp.]MBK9487640.1 hypothetical protein [Haliscomenobacter sp.]
MSPQIVTITFFRYSNPQHKWWGFKQMALAPLELAKIAGLSFSKMMGSGNGNGFSIWPNFGVYGLLAVWDDAVSAEAFFSTHPLFNAFKERAKEIWTVYLQTAKVHGTWDGGNPFTENVPFQAEAPVAVLTRATIRTKRLWHFWRFVPGVSKAMWREHQEGLLFSVGIGELPLVQQATFSLWKNSADMQAYAYKGKFHSEVVRKTRELGWYKEELFARFHPYRVEGTWGGETILSSLFPPQSDTTIDLKA